MANEKFKFYGIDGDGNTKLAVTENHPKLDATSDDISAALTASTSWKGLEPSHVVLTSDTTVFTAE